jgi:hypothetical protein
MGMALGNLILRKTVIFIVDRGRGLGHHRGISALARPSSRNFSFGSAIIEEFSTSSRDFGHGQASIEEKSTASRYFGHGQATVEKFSTTSVHWHGMHCIANA